MPCVRDTDHLFLELPLLKEKLERYISEASGAGSWSQNAIQATNAWLKEGLKPCCITRDLQVRLDSFFSRLRKCIICSTLEMYLFLSLDMQESQFWKLYKQDPASCATVMKTSVGLVYLLACLLEPFMSSFSKQVCPFRSQDRGTCTVVQGIDILLFNHMFFVCLTTLISLMQCHCMQENNAVKCFRENFAGSQDEQRLRTEVAAQLETTKLSS
uniref:Methionine--tRNA ligase, putative / methionyl-tRNA synthetase, putative / MetRS, putative n=1 Tax=Arundo donax TaxID=35708 RepID=A0A0A9DXD5_ARUDO